MERTNKKNTNKSNTPNYTANTATAVIGGKFEVDYEGDKYIFLSTKVPQPSNPKYYTTIIVRVPVEIYDTVPQLESIIFECGIENYFDRKKNATVTTFTAFRYTEDK